MSLRKSRSSGAEKVLSLEEQQAKINQVRTHIHPLSERLPNFCSDDSILNYLRARNWNTEKAAKLLKEAVKWRLEYKPEAIRWEDIAKEAETGRIYRADYLDKYGRTVLVMRPGLQNTSSTKEQIKYLVYYMENAVLNSAADQEEMVWLIDFQGWTMASISINVTRETAHVLQDYYPGRLGLAILYNPPRIFESFWKIVKPFLEPETYKKVTFVYSNDTESRKIMADLFDVNTLDSAFGGHNPVGFDFKACAERMKVDDRKMEAFVKSGGPVLQQQQPLASSLNEAKTHSETSLDASLPSGIASSKSAGIDNLLVDEVDVQLSCKSSAGAETVHQPDQIQMSGSG